MKCGIGFSDSLNSADAATEMLDKALSLSGTPDLVLLFTTDSHDQAQVLNKVKDTVGDAVITGSCVAGIVTEKGVLQKGTGVLAVSGEELQVVSHLEPNLGKDSGVVGEKTGDSLLSSGIQDGIVFAYPDGFQSNLAKALRGMYNRMGPGYSYAGGGSGDNLKFFRSYQYTENGLASNALSAALVSGMETSIGVKHGWEPTGEPIVVTKASGKTVYEINGLPALDLYKGIFGDITPDDFARIGMSYP
ncbi:MAG TPA: FIST N-terminal domain-containing protein [Candidatus Sabulitectum sp.]|nr:FIST N-terminal domain-containing protein [Candidatus Sabulitectum sp.]